MRVVIFGATGMVGSGVLRECLEDPVVTAVLSVGRAGTGLADPKLREIVHRDFLDFEPIRPQLAGLDACFFCIGVPSAGIKEADYHRLTHDVTIAAAGVLLAVSPGLTFCFVSGQGTDGSERGRVMWARVKGKTENALLAMPFKAAYMFRPGIIQPMKGVRSRTRLYQVFYDVLRPLLPVLRRLFPGAVTTRVAMGRAMIRAVTVGYERRVLETVDINRLAGDGESV